MFYFFWSFLLLQAFYIFCCDESGKPINFPPTIPIRKGVFDNWANDLQVADLWIATPANENDVLALANWAAQNGFKLRASGFMHNWSPLTVTSDDDSNDVLLVDTTENLTNMQTPTQISSSKYAVTAQTGASMLQFLTFLEKYGLGVYSAPAPGDLTIGGVLAIGGHGTGVPYVGEIIPSGQALGTISNLVISFKAIVWIETLNQFVLKTFQRSDVEAKAFLINFGRTFITEVTLLVGLNYNLRCESTTAITKKELYSLVPGRNTLSTLLDKSGRVEIILYPFTDNPWLKVWTIKPTKPLLSIKVNQPFNYPFSNILPEVAAELVAQIMKGAWHLTPLLANTLLTTTTVGLLTSGDIWGPSKNLLLYIKPTTLRITANGYAVMTKRSNVQKVVSIFSTYYDALVAWYRNNGNYPFNGPVEVRVTSLDKADIFGEVASFSPIHPINDHPDYDTAVYINVLSIPGTPFLNEAMTKIESFFIGEFDGTYASVRPEWSKGWAYTNNRGWSNETLYRKFVPSTFPSTTDSDGWNWAVQTLDRYDPNRVFTNSFLDSFLQATSDD